MPDPDDGSGQAPAGHAGGGGAPAGPGPARPSRPRPSFTAAEVLVGLGALSLVAAVAVFAAVSWSDLAAWAQGGLIVSLTGVVLAIAVACRRRHLVATSEALGAVGVALALADVHVARVGLDGAVGDRTTWAVGLAAVAVGTLALGRRTGIRVLGLAGGALAFAPLVIAAAGGRPLAWVAALAAQAVIGGAVTARLRDRRLDRSVVGVGAALSWAGAVVGAVGLAAAGLLADPPAAPLGPALVLAALAVATAVGGRRLAAGPEGTAGPSDLVGGAGVALALVPAVLVALGFGSTLGVLAVLAGQALLALGLGRSIATGRGERVVALAGGTASWVAATGGLLVTAVLPLVDGDPATGPLPAALVLAAVAAGSIALARRTGDAVLGGAGSAIAFPAVVAAVATGSTEATLAVVAAQAVGALALAATGRLTDAERTVARAGGATCWSLAAAGGLVLGAVRLVEGTSPVVAVSVLAVLAAGSVVLARRSGDDLLAAAGVALAFAPAALLAAATGSLDLTLGVVAAQAVGALALAATGRLTGAERTVAVVGGWTAWIVGAAGALLHVLVELAVAADDPRGRLGALLVMAGLAAGSVVVGGRTERAARAWLTAAGAGLAFLPVPLAALGAVTPTVLVSVLIGEALAAALLAVVVAGPVRTVLRTGGVVAWAGAGGGAGLLGLAGWLGTPATGPAGAVALLVALTALAVAASLLSRWDAPAVGAGLGSAVVPALLAVALAVGGLGSDAWVASMLVAAAVVAVGTGLLGRRDGTRPWTAPSVVALAAGAALAVVPFRTVLAVGAALVDRAATTPDVGAGVRMVDWLRPGLDGAAPGWAVVAQVAGTAGLAVAVARLHRRAGRVLAAVVVVGAIVVVPVATGMTVAVTVTALGIVVLAAAALVRGRPRDPELLVGALATVLVGTAVALGSAPWTVGWTVVVGLVLAGLAAEAVARRSPDAPLWVGTTVAVVLASVALDAWVLGTSGVDGLLAVAVAAAAMSPVAALLERRDEDGAAEIVDGLVGLVLVAAPALALAVTGTVFSASPFLALVGVAAGGAALRPRRRPAWLVAGASAVLLAWLQAGQAEVDLVEAYTLPLAGWALLVGGVVGRGRGSWERFGVGLLAAAGPTTVLALVDPDPVRTVVVVAVGAALALWGAAARLQAPLAVGTVAVAALAVRHLGPVGVELPRYVAFAVAGLVLVAVGATFEQRRQDLRQARDAFVRLG